MSEAAQFESLCSDFLPLFRRIPASERYAITLGGSQGKGLSDKHSDYDFRIYYDERVQIEEWNAIRSSISELINKWKLAGVEVDGAWSRSFQDIDNKLDLWLSGKGQQEPKIWSVWGYNILTDMYNQAIVEDPYGIVKAWKERLKIYPDELRNFLLKRHVSYLKYWRQDYHYQNKVNRLDIVFLASLTARLVHEIMQVVFALNKFYFPGDGLNMVYAKNFRIKPECFEERITEILYPGLTEEVYKQQYQNIIKLIDEVLLLVDSTVHS